MCVDVLVREKLADTKQQLRVLCGVEPIMDSEAHGHWPDDSCLCPCDIEATAQSGGMTAEYVGGWWELTPNV